MEGNVICKEFEQMGLALRDELVERSKTNEELRELLVKDNKSIEGCCKYIYAEITKGRGQNKALMHKDTYIIDMAIDYYRDDTKIGINLAEKTKAVEPKETKAKPKAKEEPKKAPMQFDLFSQDEDDNEDDM